MLRCLLLLALASGATPAAAEDDVALLAERARRSFGTLPSEAARQVRPVTDEQVELGRMLFHDKRLSKNHDLSCNNCHQLSRFGVDGKAVSNGHRGRRALRNAPSVFNAALQFRQFWDGRAADVEDLVVLKLVDPVGLAQPDPDGAAAALRSIPGYRVAFAAAFPGETAPVNSENLALAIGAFLRRLLSPAPLDRFIAGDRAALSAEERAGLETFRAVGCTSCHVGVALGGGMFQKLGVFNPYKTADPGRFGVTGDELDRGFFKVPSLRNVAKTGPWFHDGTVTRLSDVVRLMGEHQLGVALSDKQVSAIVAFLKSLTGVLGKAAIVRPVLPASGDDTPAPDSR